MTRPCGNHSTSRSFHPISGSADQPHRPYVLDTNNWSGTIEQWLIASPDGERFIAHQFSTASPDGYRVAVAAMQAGMLLVGVDDIESEASEWWRHTLAD